MQNSTPPFFTIITATYNAAATLPQLLESLAFQTCRDFSWVVQDGGSSDATLQIIDAWCDRLPDVSVESAPDKGIYDAWNRALTRRHSQLGQWVLFLGADDVLADAQVFARAKAILSAQPGGVDLGAGDLQRCCRGGLRCTLHANIPQAFAMRSIQMLLPHPALFAARHLLHGQPFDTSFRIAGDYDWLLRVWRRVEQAVPLGFVVTHMGSGGVSDNAATEALLRAENRQVMRRYPPTAWHMWPRYIFAYAESCLHEYKLSLKQSLCATRAGRRCWEALRHARKKLSGGDANARR